MSYAYGVVHAIVQYEDCDWHTESYKNAQAIAAKHAKKYGHKVSDELGIAFSYDYHSSPSRINNKEAKK